jgi:hypothetical protein
MTPPELRTVRRTARKAVLALDARNQAIRDAHAAGATIRAIAVEAELSPARVHQILHGR